MSALDLSRRRAAIARAERSQDEQAATDARRDYAAAKLADYIERVVDSAPPLTPEQLDRLAGLLRGGGDLNGAA